MKQSPRLTIEQALALEAVKEHKSQLKTSLSIEEWFSQRCPEEELASRDGIFYLPIDTCERKLDKMYELFNIRWRTQNYKSSFYNFNNVMWVSASLELVVLGRDYYKTLVGCSSFRAANIAPNEHLDATAKSFCVVNAASDLGDQFGRFLATQQTPPVVVREKLNPDIVILKKYEIALKNGDEKTIKELSDIYKLEPSA